MTAPELVLPDVAALTDLQTFVGRAKQVDPGGAIRMVAHGEVLAVYAGALHGGGGPTVLALRVLTLAEPSEADVTVPLAALADRFGPPDRPAAADSPAPSDRLTLADRVKPVQRPVRPMIAEGPIGLALPSATATGASWAGLLPPRVGWSVEGVLRVSDLRRAARAGIDEVAAGTPTVAGAAAVAKLRTLVWGRPLLGHSELPAGTAFAAEVFGFLGAGRSSGRGSAGSGSGSDEEVFDQNVDQDAVSLHRAGRWWRLSTTRGHVLARPSTTLG
jgi:hypothetical protein